MAARDVKGGGAVEASGGAEGRRASCHRDGTGAEISSDRAAVEIIGVGDEGTVGENTAGGGAGDGESTSVGSCEAAQVKLVAGDAHRGVGRAECTSARNRDCSTGDQGGAGVGVGGGQGEGAITYTTSHCDATSTRDGSPAKVGALRDLVVAVDIQSSVVHDRAVGREAGGY